MREFEENYGTQREKDLVLNMNEYAHILSKTDGSIKTVVGPFQISLSQQEVPVIFNTRSKKFDECKDYAKAKRLFVSAPENWYVVLKNPTENGEHPEAGRNNATPKDIQIGKKINVFGPTSFTLHAGQMAKVVQGHRIRSNQYLLARVYDADAANANKGVVTDADGNESKTDNKYFNGQLLVIKGTEISFYIPPTGIEVIPVSGRGEEYVRDAVTLERLEYCILKDESGEKRYLHGPQVVFPKPTETFVKAAHGGCCYRAIELTNISGIYVKVIAEYTENGVTHPIGEELFLTGKDQRIYYPRPEHAVISYDGKYMHHAIAIPKGEGRYIMNRDTGEIKTVTGPAMYLPDPRTEVVIKRKLTEKQCDLWFPGNYEVKKYNQGLNERAVEKANKRGIGQNYVAASAFSDASAMDILESNAGISRGTSYTKPRTITLDTKFDGVVGIDVWTGYAINVVSKSGEREVVVGPTSKLLDYDQSLEVLSLSTGKPKTIDFLEQTVYLRVENNKVSDVVNVQTSDFVNVSIRVSYCVDFLKEFKDKWFSIENYVKYMCDRQRSLLKREIKNYTIEEFYANSTDIVRKVALNLPDPEDEAEVEDKSYVGRLFKENGMLVKDVEVLSVQVEREVAELMNYHQEEMIKKTLELSKARRQSEVEEELASLKQDKMNLQHTNDLAALELRNELAKEKAKIDAEKAEFEREMAAAAKQAEADLQATLDEIAAAKLARMKAEDEAKIEYENKIAEIEKAKQEAYANTVKSIMESIQPELVAAMQANANADIMNGIGNAVSPYAIAENKSVAEVANTLLRGTSLEQTMKNIKAATEE